LGVADAQRFGGIDADADSLLEPCFRNHPAYLDALEHRRFLIVGRKGSGKTAIYKKLITRKSPDHLAFGHSFDDYPWQHHDLQAQSGVPEERRYIHSWMYLIEVSLARLLLSSDQSQPWHADARDDLNDLEHFIVDSYGRRDPDLRQIFNPERKLRFRGGKWKGPAVEINGEYVALTDLPKHIQEVNQAMSQAAINCLNPDNHYFICFDQLDLGFEPEDSRYHNRLIGLILAARHMNHLAARSGKNLTVAVFLRDDIYEILRFEDKNKTTESGLVHVRWSDRTEPGSLTLRELMESRFSEVLGGGEDDLVSWDDVFDESKEMPGRQLKYQHICDRTFLRPRDMIKFCNEVHVAHRGRVGADGLFENKDLADARTRYSVYLLHELDDEIHKHVAKYEDYLEVIRSIGSLQFKRSRFEQEFANRIGLVDHSQEAGEALRQLFEFSVIGIVRSGGASGGSRIIWRYKDSRAKFQPEAEVFRVHAGFKEALDLTQGERKEAGGPPKPQIDGLSSEPDRYN
jgi:hypothetical protein